MQALKVPLYPYHDIINYTNNLITFFYILRSTTVREKWKSKIMEIHRESATVLLKQNPMEPSVSIIP